MPLRKVLLSSSVQSNNASSFVNQTAKRLHIKKIRGVQITAAADTLGEVNQSSLDEVPVTQANVNDSRSHIASTQYYVGGGTGAVSGASQPVTLSFNRNDLFLDPDEALFVNNAAIIGSATPTAQWNIWYED